MDQVSAFQVYSTMKKLKPSKQKRVKRLKQKKKNQALNAERKVKEKIENALQDLELVQKTELIQNQKKTKKTKTSSNHQSKQNAISTDSERELTTDLKGMSRPVASSSYQRNPKRSSVHENTNKSQNGNGMSSKLTNSFKTSKPEKLKKGNKLASKLEEPQKKKEVALNKEKTKTKGNPEENARLKTSMSILCSDSTLSSEDSSPELTEPFTDSMFSDDPDYDSMEELEIFDHVDPVEESVHTLDFLLHPITTKMFMAKYWEKTPILIKGKRRKFFCGGKPLVSSQMIDTILRKHHIQYTKNIDITAYTNGVRETLNPEGRAYPSVVWDYYSNDCSIRFLNPQTYIPNLHSLNATLQEFFGCFVGANVYLTPPNSQGFAPHYDDIEAFILQLEGQKRWRLYKPRSQSEVLPRYSSRNFTDADIGEPFMDVVLKQGDLLYFPRGTIHQGETIDDKHSLHVTLSVYQKNSWADFLEKLVPQALQSAINDNAKFRVGMPVGYLQHLGKAYEGQKSEMRDIVTATAKNLIEKMIKYLDVDKAADEMAKNHIHDFLPPILATNDRVCSVFDDGETMDDGIISHSVEIGPDVEIRLTKHHCARLVYDAEDNMHRLYYSIENSNVYHEYELQYLEIDSNFVSATKKIINVFPEFIRVEDLPIVGLDLKIQFAKDLWERGLVITKVPLPEMDDI